MKFTFIPLLFTVAGVVSFKLKETFPKINQDVTSQDTFDGINQPRIRFWSNNGYGKNIQRPIKYRPINEKLGPVLFPPQELPFPKEEQSLLIPSGSQNFNVATSINFGGDFHKAGSEVQSFDPERFQTSSASFSSLKNRKYHGANLPHGLNRLFSRPSPVEYLKGTEISDISTHSKYENIGPSSIDAIFPDQPSFPVQSFDEYPNKYASTLAKNPLFLVLKLLITEPSLWVSSPVLYHGLAHTGIVKPFPPGFGIYGYRFANIVPESQAFGSSNILNVRA